MTTGWGAGGYGSIEWSLNAAETYAGGKSIVATENGYPDAGTPDAIPPDLVGRYMPRLLLEQFRAGITRTYLYELLEWPGSGNYGLLKQDGSPKPAFHAVKGLLNLLADPGPAFTPKNLAYTVTGGPDVRHMLFQKRDGTYFLALWLGVSGYDNESGQYIVVAPENVTVTLPTPMRMLKLHRWQATGLPASATSKSTTATIPMSVSDALTVIEFTAKATGSTTRPTRGTGRD